MTLSQRQYIQDMFKEYDLHDGARTVDSPLVPNEWLWPRSPDEEPTDTEEYRRLVGTLRYLAEGTCPDIAFAASHLAQHLHDPCFRHEQLKARLPLSRINPSSWSRLSIRCFRASRVQRCFLGRRRRPKISSGLCFYTRRRSTCLEL